jgi:signal transduction histidine kinase
LVSSKVTLEDRLRGYEAGADDYITKPFEGAELLAKVKVFLRLKDVEEIDRLKTNFITLLTHETRTPLTGILGFAALIRDSPSLGEKENYFLDQIARCAHVLSRLSEKTVLLSDLKTGKIRIEKGKIHLTDILAECHSKLTAAAQGKQLLFSSRIDPDLWIHGDPNLIAIAFDVLLDNAVKFAREGTVVDVAANVKRPHIVVEVANDGEQIPAEHHEDIFDELSVRDVDHLHQGHGLSLAIARRIIESHEGVLSVTNRDNGPVFVIDFYCPEL